MQFKPTPLAGAKLIALNLIGDDRGSFARLWCSKLSREQGLFAKPEQCNVSRNLQRGTLRGLHFQRPPHLEAKLVRCTQGKIFDVIVDLRHNSVTAGQWYGTELSADGLDMLYIPEGFAHGFITLEPNTEVFYMMSTSYVAGTEAGIKWNDPDLAITWPIEPKVISERDRALPNLRQTGLLVLQ